MDFVVRVVEGLRERSTANRTVEVLHLVVPDRASSHPLRGALIYFVSNGEVAKVPDGDLSGAKVRVLRWLITRGRDKAPSTVFLIDEVGTPITPDVLVGRYIRQVEAASVESYKAEVFPRRHKRTPSSLGIAACWFAKLITLSTDKAMLGG